MTRRKALFIFLDEVKNTWRHSQYNPKAFTKSSINQHRDSNSIMELESAIYSPSILLTEICLLLYIYITGVT